MAISNKLTELNGVKQSIKQAIVDKGVDMTGVAFNGYAGKIGEIETGGGASGYTVTFVCYGGMFIGPAHIIQANGSDFVVQVGEDPTHETNIFENVTYIKGIHEYMLPASYTGITEAEYRGGKTLTNDITLEIYD